MTVFYISELVFSLLLEKLKDTMYAALVFTFLSCFQLLLFVFECLQLLVHLHDPHFQRSCELSLNYISL